MSPNDFILAHEITWMRLEKIFSLLQVNSPSQAGSWFSRLKHRLFSKKPVFFKADKREREQLLAEFPALYRQVCQHLALARSRHYPPYLIDRLHHLALQGHQLFYTPRTDLKHQIFHFIVAEFPHLIRQHLQLLWLATAFTCIPAVMMAVLVWQQPEMIYSLMAPENVNEMEAMYSTGKDQLAFKREAGVNFKMFGHYIKNNISIGFSCFAGGLFFGIGAIAPLILNGMILGAISVHLVNAGFGQQFFQFVVAHAAFELTAIVLCGMAGLMLGRALIAPGSLTRKEAVALHARPAVKIVYGATGMLLIAAFVEAFWSSSTFIPVTGKFFVGGLLWLLVIGYFVFMGRSHEA